ncbi:sulfatase-like hydrolase/transferase [Ideonella sp. DXS29W]|uniref:Sulfatase-like hydrolase/transferase n=1 Tax=Ideonella lacteola TaxID=2984193 RepID=A0ABU9BN77_9BURK
MTQPSIGLPHHPTTWLRRGWRWAAIAVLSLHVACGGGGGGGGGSPPPPQRSPNVVFILTDDQSMPTLAQMPWVKSLLTDSGTSFERHYVSLSLCCPSRISGLRGQYAHNTTIYRNGAPDGGFEAVYQLGLEDSTVATWLQAAGYRTALFGKYLNGYPDAAPSANYIPPGWTEFVSPNDGLPYRGFNYSLNDNGRTVVHGEADADYLTDVLSAKVIDFIRRSASEHPDQPFFAYVAPYAPHAPATPAPRHENLFNDAIVPRTGSFNEADVSDKPAWVRALPLLDAAQIDQMDKIYRNRLRSLQAVDEMVRDIVQALQAQGQLEHTYIFFASDNGHHQGQHRMDSGKMTAYEEDIRVPLIVRGPGVPRGGAVSLITANVDYAPTLAAIAGTSAPAFVDGRSLLPLLQGQTPSPWRQVLLLEHKLDNAADQALIAQAAARGTLEPPDPFDLTLGTGPQIASFTGLRTASGLTYVEYDTAEHELYDNGADPYQLTNTFSTAATDLKTRLAALTTTLRTAQGAGLRAAEETAP